MQAPAPADAAVLRVGGYQTKLAMAGVVIGLIIAASVAVSLIAGGDNGVLRILVAALGVLSLGLAVFSGWQWLRHRNCRLIIDAAGVRLQVPKHGFAVRWAEFSGVRVAWTVATAGATQTTSKTISCHLDLFPGDTAFRGRHPELEHYWERRGLAAGYRVLLGGEALVGELEAALRRFAPALYLGVARE